MVDSSGPPNRPRSAGKRGPPTTRGWVLIPTSLNFARGAFSKGRPNPVDATELSVDVMKDLPQGSTVSKRQS